MKEKLSKWVNLFLMVDLFFVLFCFAWFVVALLGKANQINLGFDLWYQLWTPVMQPAIGLLMMGAIASGVSSWIAKRFGSAT